MELIAKSSIFFCLIILIVGCGGNKYDIDTSDIAYDLKFVNSDSILSSASNNDLLNHRTQIKLLDQDVAGYIFGYCFGIRMQPDTSFLNGLHRFYKHAYSIRLESRIKKQLNNKLPRFSNDIKDAFKRLKYHKTEDPIPSNVFWVNSGFASSVFCSKKSIAVGLERYLGEKTDVIKELPGNQFFSWIKEGMDERYLVRDVMVGWISTHCLEETKENYASEMIRWGKILFLSYASLPNEHESVIMRYTKKDYDWALASEGALWKYIVDEQLLYNTGEDAKQSLLHEGPFTRGLPQESPDRMGQFLGYRMVKQYMENHDISLNQLKKTAFLTILQAYEAPEK